MSISEDNLVWIDMEMSGLDPETDRILEMATIITDSELNVIAEGPVFAIYQSEEVLRNMDEWNTSHHTRSGLVERVKESRIDEAEAEKLTLEFISSYVAAGQSPLCGNSIFQDRRFISRYMKSLDKFLHYRLIDVSTVKELARRWNNEVCDSVKKAGSHKALDDIRESIAELQHYHKTFFKLP
ncbi:MAG: oligoribonuclease [Pseudomonadota bacterium]